MLSVLPLTLKPLKYARWHKLAHDWSFRHFADAEYGEWYSSLHRDGSVSIPLKGHLSKGGFHVPRMYWRCWMMLADMQAESHAA